MKSFHKTRRGRFYLGEAEELHSSRLGQSLRGKVQLVLTSPPFPLNKKKRYGNRQGEEFKIWLASFADLFADLLKPGGSIAIELGNAWEPGRPVQSLLSFDALMAFVRNKEANLRLCQEFICYNPARLPSPAAWVTIERIRTIDSYTRVWWMAKTDRPKAHNSKVLMPYSQSMRSLLRRQKYNAGNRPSEHRISPRGFLKDHGGSIPRNVLTYRTEVSSDGIDLPSAILKMSNTNSNDYFLRQCRAKRILPHPARMPLDLASFFIQFLTDPGDIVLDPFAGSNVVGYCAERLGRKWVSIEPQQGYAKQAKIRLNDPSLKKKT